MSSRIKNAFYVKKENKTVLLWKDRDGEQLFAMFENKNYYFNAGQTIVVTQIFKHQDNVDHTFLLVGPAMPKLMGYGKRGLEGHVALDIKNPAVRESKKLKEKKDEKMLVIKDQPDLFSEKVNVHVDGYNLAVEELKKQETERVSKLEDRTNALFVRTESIASLIERRKNDGAVIDDREILLMHEMEFLQNFLSQHFTTMEQFYSELERLLEQYENHYNLTNER
jgi:hypothetical protein